MSVATIDQKLTDLLSPKGKKFLHYVNTKRPFLPALCGKEAPKKGWWSDKEAEAEAAVDSWEICPACQVKYFL